MACMLTASAGTEINRCTNLATVNDGIFETGGKESDALRNAPLTHADQIELIPALTRKNSG